MSDEGEFPGANRISVELASRELNHAQAGQVLYELTLKLMNPEGELLAQEEVEFSRKENLPLIGW